MNEGWKCRFVGHDWKHLGRRVGTPEGGGISYEYDGDAQYECLRCGERAAERQPIRPFYRAWWMFWRRLVSGWWLHASGASHPRRRRPSSVSSVHWYGNAPWSVWFVEVFLAAPLFSFYQAWACCIHYNGYGPFWPADWACRASDWLYRHYKEPRTQWWAFKDRRDGDFDGWRTVPYWWPADQPLPDPAPRMRVRDHDPLTEEEMSEPGTYGTGGAIEIELSNPDPRARWANCHEERPKRWSLELAEAMRASPYKETA